MVEKDEQEEGPEAPEEPGDSLGEQSPTGALDEDLGAGEEERGEMVSPPKSEEND